MTLTKAMMHHKLFLKGGRLTEMWNILHEELSQRELLLEEHRGLWISYEEKMVHVTNSLTNGEIMLAEMKSNQGNTKEVLKNFVGQLEVSIA